MRIDVGLNEAGTAATEKIVWEALHGVNRHGDGILWEKVKTGVSGCTGISCCWNQGCCEKCGVVTTV